MAADNHQRCIFFKGVQVPKLEEESNPSDRAKASLNRRDDFFGSMKVVRDLSDELDGPVTFIVHEYRCRGIKKILAGTV